MSEGPAPNIERRHLDDELNRLKAHAGGMGDWALSMVHEGWGAFRAGDLSAAQKVLERDDKLDQFDQDIEHEVISFLVLQKPSAGDLRTAASLLKATTHLDRIGRLGFDIARVATRREATEDADEQRISELLDSMDQSAEAMVRQAVDSLVKGDEPSARQLFSRDDEVDRMYRQAARLCVRQLVKDPLSAQLLSGELMVARHFERIADNACKIAERTIYAVTGQRRAEYLPRHPYQPYALEPPRGP